MPTSEELSVINGSLQNMANITAQANLNKRTRKWNEDMYKLQRKDALADWTMQNEYNSPTSQMARLREAGLNPNLVYGKGADNTSQAVRSTEAKGWSPDAPKVDLGAQYDFAAKQAQTDNLKAQNTVLKQEALLKAVQAQSTAVGTAGMEFDLGLKNSLRQNSLDMAAGHLRKLNADIDYTLNQNERAAAQNAATLKQAAQQLINSQLEGAAKATANRILQSDEKIKALDAQFAESGVRPNDGIWWRILGQMWKVIREGGTDPLWVPEKFR